MNKQLRNAFELSINAEMDLLYQLARSNALCNLDQRMINGHIDYLIELRKEIANETRREIS